MNASFNWTEISCMHSFPGNRTASTDKSGRSSSVWTVLQCLGLPWITSTITPALFTLTLWTWYTHAGHYPVGTLESPLTILKALEMLFVSCMTALCPKQACIYHLNSSRWLNTRKPKQILKILLDKISWIYLAQWSHLASGRICEGCM